MTKYVEVVTFPQNSTAYEVQTKLGDLSDGYDVESSVIVERSADGTISVPSDQDAVLGEATLGGSLIGLLIGILGGPLGMLAGWTVGLAGGALVDADRSDDQEEATYAIGKQIKPGGNGIILVTNEDDPSVLSSFIAKYDGTVVRRTTDEVLSDLEAQEKAANAADKAARKELREEKKKEHHEKFEDRVSKLKAKFGK